VAERRLAPRGFSRGVLALIRQHVSLTHEYGAIYEYNEEAEMRELLPLLKEAGVDIVKTLTPPPDGDVDLAAASEKSEARFVCAATSIRSASSNRVIQPQSKMWSPGYSDRRPGRWVHHRNYASHHRIHPEENVRAYFRACRKYGNYGHLGQAR